jgi:hypothetical protein
MSRGGCCAVLSRSLAQFGPKPGPRKATALTPRRGRGRSPTSDLSHGSQELEASGDDYVQSLTARPKRFAGNSRAERCSPDITGKWA